MKKIQNNHQETLSKYTTCTYMVAKFDRFCQNVAWWPLFTMGVLYLLNSLYEKSRYNTMKETITTMVMSTNNIFLYLLKSCISYKLNTI
jgi:cell shape-determining protein MreD